MSETLSLSNSPLDGLDHMTDLSTVPEMFPELLVSIRRHLHKHPEIGFQEVETSKFIRSILELHGLEVQGPVAETGLFVDIKGEHAGPLIAYRADMDALPIQGAKDVAYASVNPGASHLCGHDAHTTIAVGVTLLLSRLRHLIHGTIRVFFQPNEEGFPSGAPLMIRDGVMDDVTAAFACHVDPTLKSGTYGLIPGAATASADRFRVRVMGPTTGHSARPHEAVDTIWIMTLILSDLYQMIGRITDARNSAVMSVCVVHAGDADNVIPSLAEFGGTLRCTAHDDRETIKEYIIKTSGQIAEIHGARVEVDFDFGAPPIINDRKLTRIVRETILEIDGPGAIVDIPRPSMGAEDFANYLDHCPGMMLRVGTSSGPSTSHVLHDAMFDLDERTLASAATLMTRVLLRTLLEKSNEQA